MDIFSKRVYIFFRMFFPDSHIHITEIPLWTTVGTSSVCASTHSEKDFLKLEELSLKPENAGRIVKSFGIHPQNPDKSLLPFLERLLSENKLDSIGEMGFDLFSPEFASRMQEQEEVWKAQLCLAIQYQKPLVIHCRRAMNRLFLYASTLKKLPAVVFHSFPGSTVEALSFVKRGVNAYFSIGKQVLNGNKKVISCAEQLPQNRLLAETDAPYQTLKREVATMPCDIVRVYEKIAELRGEPLEEICSQFEKNFKNAFSL